MRDQQSLPKNAMWQLQCRDQDAVIFQVRQGKTVKVLEDDHGKLEL